MLSETDKVVLNFTEAGKGKITLVFLHYFGGAAKSWSAVIAGLKNSFRCIAIDICGFGYSPAPCKELSVQDNADLIIRLLNDLQLERYVLIGHSMGGKIALSIASQQLAGLTSLILIAPSPPTPEPMTDEARRNFINAFGDRHAIEKLIKKITRKMPSNNLFEEAVQQHIMASEIAWYGWIEKGSRENILSLVQDIYVPLLIVSGAFDPNFSTDFLRKAFIKYFPEATFDEIQDAGHLIPIEAPFETARSIKKFIKDKKL